MTSVFEISPLADGMGIRVEGEVDLANAHELREALANISVESEIHLDLAELLFIDSSGLRVILSFAESLNGAGPLVILNPSPAIGRLLEITAINTHPKVEVRPANG